MNLVEFVYFWLIAMSLTANWMMLYTLAQKEFFNTNEDWMVFALFVIIWPIGLIAIAITTGITICSRFLK